MMTEIFCFFFGHRMRLDATTSSKPGAPAHVKVESTDGGFLDEVIAMQDRARHGQTTTIHCCVRCGSIETTTVLGTPC